VHAALTGVTRTLSSLGGGGGGSTERCASHKGAASARCASREGAAGLEEVADDCKIEKKGHRARLFKRLEQLRATAAPPAGPLFD